MSRIHEAFRNGKAFIPFITCGDPDLDTTIQIVRSAVEKGFAEGYSYPDGLNDLRKRGE